MIHRAASLSPSSVLMSIASVGLKKVGVVVIGFLLSYGRAVKPWP